MLPLAAVLLAQSYVTPDEIDRARLAIVNVGPRRYFRQSPYECAARDFSCRRRGYVLPGDQVMLYEMDRGFARIEFVDARGRSSIGWIAANALSPADARPGMPWAGEWSRPNQRLRITAAPRGRYRIQGDAIFPVGDPNFPDYHSGVFWVTALPRGGRLAFGADALNAEDGVYANALPYDPNSDIFCQVRMRRLGTYLLVHNRACGGYGVSFNGAYRQIRWGSQPLPNDR